MREFTDFEKQIIDKIVIAKDLKESCLAKLIDENTDAIALEWVIDKPSFYIIYRPANLSDDGLFNQIQEIVFLLKSLEESNLIYLHQNEKLNEDNCLYNHKKYKREKPTEYSVIENNSNSKGHILTNTFEVKTDFGRYVERYTIAFFYASNALRELVKNGYKTPEQKQFEVQLRKAEIQIRIAWAAFFIACITILLPLCTETKIDKGQINQIKQTIQQNTLPDVIKAEITNDTITARIVEKPKNQSKEQIK